MPSLPRRNNLDYNDDGIIQASKQLTTIGLKNMKNELTMPDQSALSSLSSQKSLSGSIDDFSKLLLGLQSSFIKAKQEGARIVGVYLRQRDERQRQARQDQDDEMGNIGMRMNEMENIQRQLQEEQDRMMRGRGRPKGSKNKIKTPSKPSTLLQIEDAPPQTPNIRSFFGTSQPVRRVVSAEPVGRYGVLPVADYSNRMISQGAIADAEIEDPDDELDTEPNSPSYNREDSESSSIATSGNWYNPTDRSSSSRSSNRYRYGGDGDGDGWDDGDGDDTNSSHYSNVSAPFSNIGQVFVEGNPNTILSSLILDITRQIRYLDLLLISKIKPAVQHLNTSQLNTLSQAYTTLTDLWKDFSVITVNNTSFSLVEYFKDVVSFGDQIIRILEEELKKLKIDLLIVVNSYKQNEAIQSPNFTPDSFWENSAVREMQGAGRTFTGRNHSGRDIPTIWRGAQRECAYKYML